MLTKLIYVEVKVSPLVTALFDVINEFYLKPQLDFEILIFGRKSKDIDVLLNEVLRKCDAVRIKITSISHQKGKSTVLFPYNTIFLFDDVKSFFKFKKFALFNSGFHRKNAKFIVYCHNLKHNDIEKLMINPRFHFLGEDDTELLMYYVVKRSKKEFELVTPEYFTKRVCRKLQLVTLNKFNVKKKKWIKNALTIPEKFQKFHDCMIGVTAIPNFDGYTYDRLDGSLRGFYFDLVKILEQRGNFTAFYKIMEINLKTKPPTVNEIPHQGFIFDSQLIFNERVNYVQFFVKGLQFTTSTTEETVIFAITPAEKLTNFEKVLLPFDELTWELLIVTFCGSMIVIFCISFTSMNLRNIFFGVKVQTPILNVVGTFFGISQTVLPQKSFARFILMNFILFCLIMRTAYQGVLFELMATDMRKKLPETIDDLIERNYTIICHEVSARISECWMLNYLLKHKRYKKNFYFSNFNKKIYFKCQNSKIGFR